MPASIPAHSFLKQQQHEMNLVDNFTTIHRLLNSSSETDPKFINAKDMDSTQSKEAVFLQSWVDNAALIYIQVT